MCLSTVFIKFVTFLLSVVFITERNGKPFHLDIPERAGGGVNTKLGLKVVLKSAKSLLQVVTLAQSPADSSTAFDPRDRATLSMSAMQQTIALPTLKLKFVKAIRAHGKTT